MAPLQISVFLIGNVRGQMTFSEAPWEINALTYDCFPLSPCPSGKTSTWNEGSRGHSGLPQARQGTGTKRDI